MLFFVDLAHGDQIATSYLFTAQMAGAGGQQGAVRGLDDFDFKSFLNDIPPVTRTLVLSMVFCTLGGGFQLLPASTFGLFWPLIIGKFQIWRLLTSFLHLGSLGFSFLINVYFVYHYSAQLERGFFMGRTADYCWMLFLVMVITLACSLFVPVYAAGPALQLAILHVWGRQASNVTVRLYGFIAIPAKFLSLATIGLEVVTTGSVIPACVIGLAAGHVYYFLDKEYPQLPSGKRVISTPVAFESFIAQACATLSSCTGLGESGSQPVSRQPFASTVRNPASSRSTGGTDFGASASGVQSRLTMPNLRPGSHSWGRGQKLGSN